MVYCSHPGCGWQSIAPSEAAAWDQYAEHLVAEHADEVEADIPEGMVQIKLGPDEEWVTATVEEAHQLHDEVHGE
ncbi:MAG: hypothetical protein ABEJ89_04025 [Haloarculaceae archaeon]